MMLLGTGQLCGPCLYVLIAIALTVLIWQDKRKASRFKIPPEAPRLHDWHVERKPLVAEACSLLGVGQSGDAPRKPRRVGLAGPGGAGKSTVASMVIIRADVRAYFEDGVLWLQVGQGAKERLLELKSRLADMVYETVKQKTCRGRRKKKNGDPEDEDGVEYIAHVMPKGKLRFLVVADDVWDVEVLQVLERTGAWVLYTTRENDLAPETPLRLDQVREEEAELLLRRAADVNDDADLPPAAYDLMKRCEFAALDLVFVGRWSDVRGRRENVEQAWRKVLNRIEDAQRRGQDVKLLSWRAAMLRAGLDELAGDNPKNKKLYLSLAVIPKGLAFPPEVAAVLLYGSEFSTGDLEAAETIVVTLERWSVLTLDDGGRYRIHDEHSDFIRDRGTANKGVLDSVLPQWREYMSSKRALLAFSGDWLDEIWKVLDRVDGAEAVVGKFDAALKEMGSSDPELEKALHNAAEFHGRRKEYMKEHSKSLRLLDVQERKGEGSSSDMDWTLNALGVSAGKAGRMDEAEQYFRPALAIWEDKQGLDRPDMEWTLNALGARAGTSGETEKAEELTRQALAVIQEDRLSVDHLDEDKVLKNLGLCARKAGKTKEAKELFRRALSIRKAKLGTDYPDAAVGDIIHNLAVCADMAGRKEAAEDLYRQAAAIRKNHLGKHPAVSSTLYNLALCVLSMGRTKEAEDIYRQALATCPLGIDRPDMASTL